MEVVHSSTYIEKNQNEIEYELERGKPMPSLNHSVIQTNIAGFLKVNYKKQYRIVTELSLELQTGNANPDVAIYPPIEILSPKQSLDDLKDKIFDIYFPSGVKSAWIVMPSLKAVIIFKTDGSNLIISNGRVKDDILNIEIAMEDIFD
jgi:Uma2 family endonuclease